MEYKLHLIKRLQFSVDSSVSFDRVDTHVTTVKIQALSAPRAREDVKDHPSQRPLFPGVGRQRPKLAWDSGLLELICLVCQLPWPSFSDSPSLSLSGLLTQPSSSRRPPQIMDLSSTCFYPMLCFTCPCKGRRQHTSTLASSAGLLDLTFLGSYI